MGRRTVDPAHVGKREAVFESTAQQQAITRRASKDSLESRNTTTDATHTFTHARRVRRLCRCLCMWKAGLHLAWVNPMSSHIFVENYMVR